MNRQKTIAIERYVHDALKFRKSIISHVYVLSSYMESNFT